MSASVPNVSAAPTSGAAAPGAGAAGSAQGANSALAGFEAMLATLFGAQDQAAGATGTVAGKAGPLTAKGLTVGGSAAKSDGSATGAAKDADAKDGAQGAATPVTDPNLALAALVVPTPIILVATTTAAPGGGAQTTGAQTMGTQAGSAKTPDAAGMSAATLAQAALAQLAASLDTSSAAVGQTNDAPHSASPTSPAQLASAGGKNDLFAASSAAAPTGPQAASAGTTTPAPQATANAAATQPPAAPTATVSVTPSAPPPTQPDVQTAASATPAAIAAVQAQNAGAAGTPTLATAPEVPQPPARDKSSPRVGGAAPSGDSAAPVAGAAGGPAPAAHNGGAETQQAVAAAAQEHPGEPLPEVALREAKAAPEDVSSARPDPGPTPAPSTSTPVTHTPPAQVRGAPETVANLAAQILKKLDARTTRFDVQLDPAGLGRVNVRVDIGAHGHVTAAMAFDNPQAAAELKSRAGELQKALEQAGFDLSGGLSFDVAGDQAGFGRGAQGQAQNGGDAGAAFRGRAFQSALDTAGSAADAALSGGGGLNLNRGVASGVDVRI